MKRSLLVGVVLLALLAIWRGAQSNSAPSREPLRGALTAEPDPTPTPTWPPVVSIDVHAEVHADGAGQARAVAVAVGGQARADIESEGRAVGQAYANAPADLTNGYPLDERPTTNDAPRWHSPQETPAMVATAAPGLYVVVVVDLANLRAAPGLNEPIIGVAPQGARFAVQGQDAPTGQRVQWWEICCSRGRRAWVFAELVVTEGQVDGRLLAVATPTAPGGYPSATIPTLVPTLAVPTLVPTVLPTPTPDYPFRVELVEQHREANTATIYAFVHEQNIALDGYYLNVTRNGLAVPGELVRSAGVALGTTAAGLPGSIDNRIYNLKMAWESTQVYPGFVPYGAWRVQLINGAGQPVGPAVLFELTPDAEQMEMYVEYEKRK